MKILLITPPMTQINTPYPATGYLTGFLRKEGFEAVQADLSIALISRLFSRQGVSECLSAIRKSGSKSSTLRRFVKAGAAYVSRIDGVVRFLRGLDPTLALRLVRPGFLPHGVRFSVLDDLENNGGLDRLFGELGTNDRARHLASLFLDDVADAIREGVDSRFELSRYGEKLAMSATSFDPLLDALTASPTLVDRYLDECAKETLELHRPDVIGLTIPFPGNLYGGLRVAKLARRLLPETKIVLGGGYVNTELRELAEARLFDWVDFVTLDDGEAPLLAILRSIQTGNHRFLRTFVRENGGVSLKNDKQLHDIPSNQTGTPTYSGLPLNSYLSMTEMLNPMHQLWSNGRWNKLTLAHGCYWKRCTFCDTSLDYIKRFEPQAAGLVVDRMESLIRETGETGFHFVDEAAPPALLSKLADEILKRPRLRNGSVTWWTNIRFEKTFTPRLASHLANSGCIAMSGGLEVASNRLLSMMEKGVTVEQVARVTHALTEAGIMVHAYLMYGFPSETLQETVDALERVRQLFVADCIQSAFWHRFTVTVHSPVGREPEKYGIALRPRASLFAKNDVDFIDETGVDHDLVAPGLKRALYNFMHGVGLEEDVRSWFDFEVPRSHVHRDWLERALETVNVTSLKGGIDGFIAQ